MVLGGNCNSSSDKDSFLVGKQIYFESTKEISSISSFEGYLEAATFYQINAQIFHSNWSLIFYQYATYVVLVSFLHSKHKNQNSYLLFDNGKLSKHVW